MDLTHSTSFINGRAIKKVKEISYMAKSVLFREDEIIAREIEVWILIKNDKDDYCYPHPFLASWRLIKSSVMISTKVGPVYKVGLVDMKYDKTKLIG